MSTTTNREKDSDLRRAAVGFSGGQTLAIRLQDSQLTKLRTALKESKSKWLELEISDGATLIKLSDVMYLRVESDQHRVGF